MLAAALIRHLSDDQTQFVLSEVIVTGALVACSALSATCPLHVINTSLAFFCCLSRMPDIAARAS